MTSIWQTRTDEFGCELWLGKRTRDGYGLINGRVAHLVRWEQERGVLPAGVQLDHKCRRRACVALHHLEPVTQSVNEARKTWRNRVRVKQCERGHDMRLYSVVTPEGGRVCRQCNREAKT